ncbi:MAG: carbonic anhydrase [Ilumatobacteraceae bacterium]|nr:carbonic anhydrase [Ilumatobacteraceae bacterium]
MTNSPSQPISSQPTPAPPAPVQPAAFQPSVDELVAHNVAYVQQFSDQALSLRPRRQLAVVACMDSRMDIFEMLGLAHGDAHIIRNAGGVVTDDVIRSLVVSQRSLGTREIILIHHTNCGLQSVLEDQFKAEIEAETGIKPWWALESFVDPFANVRQCIKRLELSPFIAHKEHISGFVYDVGSGVLHPASTTKS